MHFPVQRVLAPRQEEQQQQRARNIFGRPTPLGGPTFSWTRSHKKPDTVYTHEHTHTQRFFLLLLLLRILSSRNPPVFFCMCVCFISFTTESFISFFYLSPPKIKIRGGFAAPSISLFGPLVFLLLSPFSPPGRQPSHLSIKGMVWAKMHNSDGAARRIVYSQNCHPLQF